MENNFNEKSQPAEEQTAKLQKKANWVRNKVLEMIVKAEAGHIASSFSCIDILVAFYPGGILHVNPKNQKWLNRRK